MENNYAVGRDRIKNVCTLTCNSRYTYLHCMFIDYAIITHKIRQIQKLYIEHFHKLTIKQMQHHMVVEDFRIKHLLGPCC